MPSARALACPASLKGVLSAREAASALAEGMREWADADELPLADGGEGTLDVLHAALGGEWRDVRVHDAFGRERVARWLALPDGTAAVEAAEAVPLDPSLLDPMRASSRGVGEMIAAVGRPQALLVCLGGTATVDGGAGLREVVRMLPAPTRVACDVDVPLLDDRGAAQCRRTARCRRGGRARSCARGLRRRARPRGAARPRRDRLRPVRLRPRRHGRGDRRCDDDARQGAGRGGAPMHGARRSLRPVRRPRGRPARRRRNDGALRRPSARPRGSR
ncbi:MAG: glycerate kinase, partial [Actinobacteria bacterium]